MKGLADKKSLLVLFAAVCILCVAGFAISVTKESAFADNTFYYYVNAGNETFTETDARYGLEGGSMQSEGVSDRAFSEGEWGYIQYDSVLSGGSMFESYRTDCVYRFLLQDGDYQIAVAVDARADVRIGDKNVSAEEDSGGKAIVSQTVSVTGGAIELAGEKIYAILISPAGSRILMHAEWTAGEVMPYGAMTEPENATGFYSDGTIGEVAILYDPIVGKGGVNLNFNTTNVTGTVAGTQVAVSRYIITMPDSLLYFINAGSAAGIPQEEWVFSDSDENDVYYDYNETVFEFYGESLLNYGIPDQKSENGGWGYYTDGYRVSKQFPQSAGEVNPPAFPFNSARATSSEYSTDVGYRLTDLEPQQSYTIYLGTMSYWHPRTVGVQFNGEDRGSLTIRPSREVTPYQNIVPDENGVIDIYLTGKPTDEANVVFIAVQKSEDAQVKPPAQVSAQNTIGLEDTSVALGNIQERAKVQIYDASRPYAVLYEEIAGEDRFSEDGSYILEFGDVLKGVSLIGIVQIAAGGCSEETLVSITDIQNFLVEIVPVGYTTESIVLGIRAESASGIVSCSIQRDYDEPVVYKLFGKYSMGISHVVEQNGSYEIVVTSGSNVTYSETVVIDTIDREKPVIAVRPHGSGWGTGEYDLAVSISSVAPVASYELYQDGKRIDEGESCPEVVSLEQTGEYTIKVTNAAGQSTSSTFLISQYPFSTTLEWSYESDVLCIRFDAGAAYTISALAVYHLKDGEAERQMVLPDNSVNIYDIGQYVVQSETSEGFIEFFGIDVGDEELAGKTSGCGGSLHGFSVYIGIILITSVIVMMRKRYKTDKSKSML